MDNLTLSTEEKISNLNNLILPELKILLQVLNYATSVIILFGNSLTIASVIKFQCLRSNNNILICSLSCADCYVGITSFMYHLSYNIFYISDQIFIFVYALLYVGYMSSVLHLVAIAFERFVGMNYSLRYHSIITPRIIKLLIFAAWGIAFVFGIISVAILYTKGNKNYAYINLTNTIIYFTAGVVIAIVYLAMLPLIYKQSKAMRQQAPQETGRIQQEIKAFATLGIMLMAYIICWTPNLVITVLSHASQNVDMYSAQKMYTTWMFGLVFSTMNSAVNFFIYAWRSKEYRRAYMAVLTCGRKGSMMEVVA